MEALQRDQFERDYREKTKEVDRLKEVEKTFELKVNRARQELDEFSKKAVLCIFVLLVQPNFDLNSKEVVSIFTSV